MAELNINGRMSVKNLKKQFKEAFGASLRVYNGKEIADEEARIASIRTDEGQDGTLEMRGNMKVGGFEAKMLETYGLRVKVADAADLQLVPDDNHHCLGGKIPRHDDSCGAWYRHQHFD